MIRDGDGDGDAGAAAKRYFEACWRAGGQRGRVAPA